MAGLTGGPAHGTADAAPAATDEHQPGGAGAPGEAQPVRGPVDPSAVRVRLAAGSRLGDEQPMHVAPLAEPLHMTNPTVGVGPLGGAALPDGDPPRAVLAQRHVLVDDAPMAVGLAEAGRDRYVLTEEHGRSRVILGPARAAGAGVVTREVLVDGFRFQVEVESERIAALRERAIRGRASSVHSGPLEVLAIIPGKVVSLSVAAGDAVTAGQELLVVEAMKMQNELRAPRDGTIERVGVAPGVNIEVGDLLVVIS